MKVWKFTLYKIRSQLLGWRSISWAFTNKMVHECPAEQLKIRGDEGQIFLWACPLYCKDVQPPCFSVIKHHSTLQIIVTNKNISSSTNKFPKCPPGDSNSPPEPHWSKSKRLKYSKCYNRCIYRAPRGATIADEDGT